MEFLYSRLLINLYMSGIVLRATTWNNGPINSFVCVHPNGEEISIHETADSEIRKISTRTHFENIQTATYSPRDFGIVAVGQLDGVTHITDMIDGASGSAILLKPKQLRPCNSVAISSTGGLLSVGYDKARQDHSVQIWDIRHASSRGISAQPMSQFFPNEGVVSTEFIQHEQEALLAGGYKFLRELDLRADAVSLQVATRCTSGIQRDPYNPNIFTSSGEDGTLAFWDRRKLHSTGAGSVITEYPLLSFSRLIPTGSSCLRLSSVRPGEFSTLFSGELIRRWQTGSRLCSRSVDRYEDNELFVASVVDVATTYDRVVSYDYAPRQDTDFGVDIICMRQSGTIFRMSLHEPAQAITWSCFNDITLASSEGMYTRIGAIENTALAHAQDSILDDVADKASEMEDRPANSRTIVEHATDSATDALILDDACTLMRYRTIRGYSTDAGSNIVILEELKPNDLGLRNVWKWLAINNSNVFNGTMKTEGVDLAYEGLLGIWIGIDALKSQHRLHPAFLEQEYFIEAAHVIISKREPGIGVKVKSAKETQRRLCLVVAGWDFGIEELHQKLERLVELGLHEKAAGWAVFHGDVARAVEILASSPSQETRVIGAAIAGYLQSNSLSGTSVWRDQCRRMASELQNPYLRVIFAFVADNDWWDVLSETALPLRERLGVALRFLPDHDLDMFLDRVSKTVIARGEIEGLVLTGITPTGMDLLQSYVDRTADVQTASLLCSYGCPRFFVDKRANAWIDAYRTVLNSWGAFSVRAQFDVARTKLSKSLFPSSSSKGLVPRQVYLQCTRCHRPIASGTRCLHCHSQFPHCSICLLSLGAAAPEDDSFAVAIQTADMNKDHSQFQNWFSYCLTCNHGMHAGHAEHWFSKHFVCAIPDCSCRCNSK